MRILLINDHRIPLGGAERYFFELKSRLQNKKNITVFSIGFGDKEETGKDYAILKKSTSKFHP